MEEQQAAVTDPCTTDGLNGGLVPGDIIMVTRGELIPQVIGSGGLYGVGGRVEQVASREFVNQVLKIVAIDGPVCIVKTLSESFTYGKPSNRVLDLSKVEYRKVAKEIAAALNPAKED